ncbi:MAG: signal peptide peptidase SppA [Bacteroidales bacterium]|nr:signal peptide peptidase SppA [Bacteroidales bacterium]
MKNFVKWTLAVICGIFIFNIIIFLISIGMIGSIAAAGSSQPVLPKSGVLYLDLSKLTIAEQSKESDIFSSIQGEKRTVIGLLDAVQALNSAAEDPSVQYLYFRSQNASIGMAEMEELRAALANFRKSGKAIISIMDSPTTASYYLASVSDKIYLTPYHGATYMLTGVSSQLIFVKDLLDKLGVNVQLIRHGKYKSAGEMFIRNSASPENLEQNQVMINSIWNAYATEIAESRGISVERLNEIIDNIELIFPEDFLEAGLVDEILSSDERKQKLADLAVVEKFDDIKFIPFTDYVSAKKEQSKLKQKIAIIYADGEIVDGNGKEEVAGGYFASQIEKVRADSTIKAVVFRVNSPGGSVMASEQIKEQIELLKKEKPVVASYGDYAASGGYWISNSCDKIYADKTTLTGSIGVFSMIPDFSGTLKDIAHVNVTTVNSNKHGDMLSVLRPLDEIEKAAMQASVEDVYTTFVNYVAEGRGLETEFVDSIAQGRVWAGSDAIGIGLVDEIGTLEDALHYAAALVNDGDPDLRAWKLVGYPKPQTAAEQIMSLLNKDSQAKSNALSGTAFESFGNAFLKWSEQVSETHDYMFARMPFEIVMR